MTIDLLWHGPIHVSHLFSGDVVRVLLSQVLPRLETNRLLLLCFHAPEKVALLGVEKVTREARGNGFRFSILFRAGKPKSVEVPSDNVTEVRGQLSTHCDAPLGRTGGEKGVRFSARHNACFERTIPSRFMIQTAGGKNMHRRRHCLVNIFLTSCRIKVQCVATRHRLFSNAEKCSRILASQEIIVPPLLRILYLPNNIFFRAVWWTSIHLWRHRM